MTRFKGNIILIMVVAFIIATFYFIFSVGKNIIDSDVPNYNIQSNDNNTNYEEQINSFLVNNFISTSDTVGSGTPEGFYFNNNRFSYHMGEKCLEKNGDLISYYGLYEIKNNKLVLNILGEEVAQEGIIEDDPINGKCLTNYKKNINVDGNNGWHSKRIEYTISSIDNSSMKFNDDTILYKLNSVGNSVIDSLKELALNGYNKR